MKIKITAKTRKSKAHYFVLSLVTILALGLCLSVASVSVAFAASLRVTNSPQVGGGDVSAVGDGFGVSERVGAWATSPEGEVRTLPEARSDAGGHVNYTFSTLGFILGDWKLTLHGQVSGLEATAPFELVSVIIDTPAPGPTTPAPGPTTPAPPPADAVVAGTNVVLNADGFTPGESISVWTTDPNGAAVARTPAPADSAGKVSYSLSTLGYVLGHWSLTVHGVSSGKEAIKTFTLIAAVVPDPSSPPPTPAPHPTSAPQGGLTVSPNNIYTGQTVQVTGAGYASFEAISFWETNPLGYATKLDLTVFSNREGEISFSYQKYASTAGIWAVTAHGQTSGLEKTGYMLVALQAPEAAKLSISPGRGPANTTIGLSGANFFGGETYSYWATSPDGIAYAGTQLVAGADGSFSFTYSLPTTQSGQWAITVSGLTSKREAVAVFISEG